MGAIYDNPVDLVGAGFDLSQKITKAYDQRLAFNALAKVYGPIVGDMDLAAKTQTYDYNEKNNPLVLQNNQLTNAGLAQTNTFNALADPLKIQGLKDANTASGQTIQDNQMKLDETTRLQHTQALHSALTGTLSGLGTSLNGVTDPAARGAAFDSEIGKLAPLLGVDPTTLSAGLAPFRQQVVDQGADALPGLQAQLDQAVQANLSPEDRAKLQIAQANVQKAQAQATTAEATAARGGVTPAAAQKIQAAKQQAKTQIIQGDRIVKRIAGKGGDADKAKKFIDDNPLATGVAGNEINLGVGKISTPQRAQLEKLLAPIKNQLTLSALARLKASGASLSPMSDSDREVVAQSTASLDLNQDPAILKQNIDTAVASLKGDQQGLVDAYKSQFGEKIDGIDDATDKQTTAAEKGADTSKPAPAGVDPELWKYMTPEEQAAWD